MRWIWKNFWQLWRDSGYLQLGRLRFRTAKINGNFEERHGRNFYVGNWPSSIHSFPHSISAPTPSSLPFPITLSVPLAQYSPNTPISVTPIMRGRMLNREEPSGSCQNSKGKASAASPSHCHFGTACFTPAKGHLWVCKTPAEPLTVGDIEMKCFCLLLSLALAWCKALCSPWKTLQRMSGYCAAFCSASICSIPFQHSPSLSTVAFSCHGTSVFPKHDQRLREHSQPLCETHNQTSPLFFPTAPDAFPQPCLTSCLWNDPHLGTSDLADSKTDRSGSFYLVIQHNSQDCYAIVPLGSFRKIIALWRGEPWYNGKFFKSKSKDTWANSLPSRSAVGKCSSCRKFYFSSNPFQMLKNRRLSPLFLTFGDSTLFGSYRST